LKRLTASFTLLIEGRHLEVEVGGEDGEKAVEENEKMAEDVNLPVAEETSRGEKYTEERANRNENDGGLLTGKASNSGEETSVSIKHRGKVRVRREPADQSRHISTSSSSSSASATRNTKNNEGRVKIERDGEFLLRVQLFYH